MLLLSVGWCCLLFCLVRFVCWADDFVFWVMIAIAFVLSLILLLVF